MDNRGIRFVLDVPMCNLRTNMGDVFTNDVNRSCKRTKLCLADRADRVTR